MSNIKSIFRFIGIFVSIFMVLWYLAPGFLNIGSILGIIFFACIGVCCIFSKRLFSFIKKLKSKKFGKAVFYTVSVIISMCVLCVAVILGAMVGFSLNAPDEDSTVVVLGCQVYGKNPSKMLRMRLESAYTYLNNNPRAKCIVSGGKGSNEQISEAECMYNWLVEKGISSDRIYMEDKSKNTKQNLEFSKDIIEKEGLSKNIAIVTDWYHEFRAWIIAKKLGYSCAAIPAPTPFYLSATFTTREILAIGNELIFNG